MHDQTVGGDLDERKGPQRTEGLLAEMLGPHRRQTGSRRPPDHGTGLQQPPHPPVVNLLQKHWRQHLDDWAGVDLVEVPGWFGLPLWRAL